MICSALGENVISYSTCKKWFQRFRNGNFNLEDDERPGQPKKFEDDDLKQLLAENPCQTESCFSIRSNPASYFYPAAKAGKN